MRGEIRDILSGMFWNEEDECCLEIGKHDDGTVITLVDYAVDTYWMFVINEKGQVVNAAIGSILEEIEGERDAE